jgi:hypothetical protein
MCTCKHVDGQVRDPLKGRGPVVDDNAKSLFFVPVSDSKILYVRCVNKKNLCYV